MSAAIQAPRGTVDVLPEEAARRDAVEGHARRILGAAGYRRIETPTFESTELFARTVGETTDIVQKEMYTFTDAGDRSLTLRPEGTAPVCRAYLEHGLHKLPQPVKLWYLSSFFRAEAPQRGRYRQFWQIGAESIGADRPEVDAELIALLAELLEAVGARDVQLHVSSLGTPEARAEYRQELISYLRAHSDEISPDVRDRIDQNPLRAFDSKDERTIRTMQSAPKLLDRLSGEDAEHFAAVRRLLDEVGLTYQVDPTLVRGLDYYTRTVFEFKSAVLGAQSTVGAGGRYDGLIEQIGGRPTPGCGWAAGMERMLLASGELPVAPMLVDLYVALTDQGAAPRAFRLARDARRAGLNAHLELSGRALRRQLTQADRLGARYVAIVADSDPTALKEMESGEQHDLEFDGVIPTILRGSRLT
ncbi:MAG: histidine--tRNA ligase [Solirubrobacteraceae bacterium]